MRKRFLKEFWSSRIYSALLLASGTWYLVSGICFAISVTHIFPESGTNDAEKTITIFGKGFISGSTTVKLKRAGESDIDGSASEVSDNELTCTFNLADVAMGPRDVFVEVNGSTGSLKSAFTVYKKIPEPVTCLFLSPSEYRLGSGGGDMRDIAIGDGDNDGELEVYGACHDSKVYQFEWIWPQWEETSWEEMDIGEQVECVVVGDGNNDGYNEVYAGGYDSGMVYQCKYSTSPPCEWEVTSMGEMGTSVWDLAIGDGNNDGELEVYAANADGNIYQYKCNGTWSKGSLGSPGGEGMGGVAVGDGDNDGKLEVYGANYDDQVYQYKYGEGTWQRTPMIPDGPWWEFWKDRGVWNWQRLAVGDGNNDREFEVYAANSNKYVCQFKCDSSHNWTNDPVDMGDGTDQMWDVAVGDGNNNGKLEVYGACYDGHVYEFEYKYGSWTKENLGSKGEKNYGVGVGDGNNDGKMEIYVANEDCKCYQYKIDDYYAPAAIVTMSASPGGLEGQITLSWTAVDEDDFKFYPDTNKAEYYIVKYYDHPIDTEGTFQSAWPIERNWPPKNPGQDEVYTIGGFTGGATYYFSIKAVDNYWPAPARQSSLGNCTSTWAQVDVAPPAKIEDLSALVGPGEGEISLTWTAVGDDATVGTADEYLVRYSTTGVINDAPTWEEATPYTATSIEPQAASFLEELTMVNLGPGTTYWVAIKAVDDLGQAGEISNSASAWAKVDTTPPADVDNLTAEPAEKEGQITLNWTAPGDDGDSGDIVDGLWWIGYSSYVTMSPGHYVTIPIVSCPAGSSQERPVTGLKPLTTYYFQLKTCDNAGNWSGLSNQTSSWAQKEWIAPAKITDLEALAGTGEGEIDLTWTAPGDDGTVGEIVDGLWRIVYSSYITMSPGHWVTISTSCSPGSPQSYTISVPLGSWYVTIAAVDDVGNQGPASDPAGPVTVQGIPPDPINDLSASEGTKEGEVDLAWTAPGDNGDEGSIVNGQWSIGYSTDYRLPITDHQIEIPIFEVSPGTPMNQTVSGLTPAATYYFCIWTADGAGNWSEPSNIASGSPNRGIPPARIDDLSAEPGDEEGKIKLSWTAVGDDGMVGTASSYILKYSIIGPINGASTWDAAIEYEQNWTPAERGETESQTLQGLPGKEHWFALVAVDDVGNPGEISNSPSAIPQAFPPARITDLEASSDPLVESQIVLTWTAVGDDGTVGTVSGYVVKYSTLPITNQAEFDSAATYTHSWSGFVASGNPETRPLIRLTGKTTYYIAIESIDDADNYGPLSNVAFASVSAFPPAAITDLIAFTGKKEGKVNLCWTAPGDDGTTNPLNPGSFRIAYSTISDFGFRISDFQIEIPTTTPEMTRHSTTIGSLIGGTTYYFRIWTCDEGSNWSKISNGATAWAQVGEPCYLEWTDEPDYVNKGINPEIGTPEEEYVYRVKYRDSKNSPPREGWPKVSICKDGDGIEGSPFEMNPLHPGSTDYCVGEIFTITISGSQLGNIGASYTYWFAAKNQRNELFATGLPTKVCYGPSILGWDAPGDLPEKLTVVGNNLINLSDSDDKTNRCRIMYWLAAEGGVTIEIFNLSGKKIKGIPVSATQLGAYEEFWDGTDANNQPVGTGVYFMRIKTKTYEKIKKIFVLR